MTKLRVMSIFGTRPEAIKMAPLVLELARREELESLVCVTAQHREMLDGVLGVFGIRPDYDLNIMKSGQTLSDITARVLEGLAGVFERARPDLVLVHGDTTTPFAAALAGLDGVGNAALIEPLSAVDMHRLIAKSYMVMTDSGGLQEEAPALGKPVLVLRGETERPEAVEAGTVKLAGTETARITALANELLHDEAAYERMARAVNPYGDGRASARIADAIEFEHGLRGEAPEAFKP